MNAVPILPRDPQPISRLRRILTTAIDSYLSHRRFTIPPKRSALAGTGPLSISSWRNRREPCRVRRDGCRIRFVRSSQDPVGQERLIVFAFVMAENDLSIMIEPGVSLEPSFVTRDSNLKLRLRSPPPEEPG